MRRPVVFIVFLLIFSFKTSLAAADGGPPVKRISQEEYVYGEALYYYLTGKYISSSGLIKEALDKAPSPSAGRDKLILFSKLLNHKGLNLGNDYPTALFKEKQGGGDIFRLLDSIYRGGAYDSLISLKGEADDLPQAAYFAGLAFLKQDKPWDARSVLAKVPKQNSLYPYAAAAMAQSDVMRRDFRSAQEELKNLRLILPQDGELAHRVDLLLGEVFFEDGFYQDAASQLMKVPPASPFYRDALMARLWSLVKHGSYEEALLVTKDIRTSPAYDASELEKQALVGYCYIKLGRFEEASLLFNDLLKTVTAEEKRFEALISGAPGRKPYIDFFKEENPSALSAHERYYLPVIQDDPVLSGIIDERRLLLDVKSAFLKKEREIAGFETYIRNMTSGLKGIFEGMGKETGVVRSMLVALNAKLEAGLKKRNDMRDANLAFFEGAAREIYARWELLLKRKMTEEEKRVIRLILYEGSEALQCDKPSVDCSIVHLIFLEKEDTGGLQKATGVLETMAMDLISVRGGGLIKWEKYIAELKGIARKKTEDGEEALKKTEEARNTIKASTAEIDDAIGKNEAKMDEYIKKRFELARYRLADFKINVMAPVAEMIPFCNDTSWWTLRSILCQGASASTKDKGPQGK